MIEFAEQRGVSRLERVTTGLLQDFAAKRAKDKGLLGETISTHTLLKTFRVLRAFFNFAVRVKGYLKGSPLSGVKLPKPVKHQIKWLRHDAMAEVMEKAREFHLFPLLTTAVSIRITEAWYADAEPVEGWDVDIARIDYRPHSQPDATEERKPPAGPNEERAA